MMKIYIVTIINSELFIHANAMGWVSGFNGCAT